MKVDDTCCVYLGSMASQDTALHMSSTRKSATKSRRVYKSPPRKIPPRGVAAKSRRVVESPRRVVEESSSRRVAAKSRRVDESREESLSRRGVVESSSRRVAAKSRRVVESPRRVVESSRSR